MNIIDWLTVVLCVIGYGLAQWLNLRRVGRLQPIDLTLVQIFFLVILNLTLRSITPYSPLITLALGLVIVVSLTLLYRHTRKAKSNKPAPCGWHDCLERAVLTVKLPSGKQLALCNTHRLELAHSLGSALAEATGWERGKGWHDDSC